MKNLFIRNFTVGFILATVSLACSFSPGFVIQRTTPSQNNPTPVTQPSTQGGPPPQSAKTKPSSVTPYSPSQTQNPPTKEASQACSKEEQQKAMLPGQDLGNQNQATCYQFSLAINQDGQSFSGAGKITFTNQTGEDVNEIFLRLYPNAGVIYGGDLTLESVSLGGQNAKFSVELADHTAVRIPLTQPLRNGSTVSVGVNFHGQAPVDMPGKEDYGIFNYDSRDQVLTLANWYPILAEWDRGKWEVNPVIAVGDAVVSPTSFYEVAITAPKNWKVVSTGTNIDPKGGYTAVSGPTRDFTIAASPNFVVTQQNLNGVQIRHWSIKGVSDQDKAMLKVATDSVDLYSQDFGQYPFNEMDMIDVPLNNASGVEYPGLILIESDLYSNSASSSYLPVVVAHEVGHQWWYSVVGNDVLEYPWLDEGLTTYTSLLYFQKKAPAVYIGMLGSYRRTIQQFSKNGISEPVTAFEGDETKYGDVVYLKSAVFFSDIRDRIGDEKFLGALRSYFSSDKFKIAKPQDLLNSFETSCGCNLHDLYTQYGALPEK